MLGVGDGSTKSQVQAKGRQQLEKDQPRGDQQPNPTPLPGGHATKELSDSGPAPCQTKDEQRS